MKKKLKEKNKYATLNNAIRTNEFIFDPLMRERIRKQYGLKEELALGHVGRFNYQKNHEYLIDSFSTL